MRLIGGRGLTPSFVRFLEKGGAGELEALACYMLSSLDCKDESRAEDIIDDMTLVRSLRSLLIVCCWLSLSFMDFSSSIFSFIFVCLAGVVRSNIPL